MKYTAGLTNASISKLGISSDFNECISEYIWNGFDAGASEVEINFKENEFGAIECINIKDNGIGIIYEDLPKTFKNVLDSNKKIIKRKNNIHGSKGKGRFSFITFADVAVWNTVYRDGDNNQKYTIKILKSEATEYEVEDKECTSEMLGTEVMLSGIYTLDKEHIFQNKFLSYLKEQFAWFLYLNKKKKYKIIIDGKELDYMESIDQNSSKDFNLNIDGYEFKINFIKWIGRIKEKYYFYFMDSNNAQIYKKYTSFNKNSLEFPHSLYVKSNYFDEFKPLDNESKVLKEQLDLFGNRNQRDKIFKELYNKLIDFLEKQIDEHIKVQAPKQVTQLENEGVFPKFNPNSKYDEMRKEDLKDVLTELYVIQPKLFNCTLEHKKTIVGFLNLLLDSNEREGIINIMDNINSLTPEERKKLDDLLRKTTLSRIIKTVSMIQNRLEVIEALKLLVYDQTNFTNERDHIQKIIEENYWLFGEQYNMVSADKNFEKALESYAYLLEGYKSEESFLIDHPQRLRRPDIFICRSRSTYAETTQDEENIIVELKAPYVTLDYKIYRQIEDYMLFIAKEKRFNSSLRKWKFIMVSTEVDGDIKRLYDDLEDKGKRFLVKWSKNFEIYAMTWDDVFKSFELNHKYILDKLEFDKTLISKDVKNISDEEGRKLVDEITTEILNLKKQLE